MKRLAVYCGSATPEDPIYIETARHVGRTLAERGIGVVYGGGRLGLMGAVADSALEAGGEVIGIIPEALVGAEVAHRGCFLTIPGGVGTMDELWEAISWAQLGYHAKPVGLLNAAGFYNELIAFNRKMVEVGFIRPAHAGIMIVDAGLDELLDKMASYVPHQTIFAMKAENL
jgi:predicted Rossmann-fold nucleotide-binding protein